MKTFKHFSNIIVNPNKTFHREEVKPETILYNIQIPKELDTAVKEVCKKENISKSLFTRSTMKYWFDRNNHQSILN